MRTTSSWNILHRVRSKGKTGIKQSLPRLLTMWCLKYFRCVCVYKNQIKLPLHTDCTLLYIIYTKLYIPFTEMKYLYTYYFAFFFFLQTRGSYEIPSLTTWRFIGPLFTVAYHSRLEPIKPRTFIVTKLNIQLTMSSW